MLNYAQIQREKIRRTRKRKTIFVFASIFIPMLIMGFFVLMHLTFFKIKGIEITGTKLIDSTNIKNLSEEAITPGFFSKILFSEDNFLFAMILKNKMVSNIMSNYPTSKSVAIKYDISNRKIEIGIDERYQYGIWCVGEGNDKCFWFDRDGFVFMKAPSTKGTLIKKIIDTSGEDINICDSVIRPYYIKTIEQIFNFLDSMNIQINTLLLKDRNLGEVETYNSNYPTIYFSLRFNPSFAVSGIQRIYNQMDKMEYIDLRVNNKVFYK